MWSVAMHTSHAGRLHHLLRHNCEIFSRLQLSKLESCYPFINTKIEFMFKKWSVFLLT